MRTRNPLDTADTCTNSLRDWVDGIMASCGQEWEERNEIVVQTRASPSRIVQNRAVKPVREICWGFLGVGWIPPPSQRSPLFKIQLASSMVTDADTDLTLDSDDTSPAVGLKKTYADAVQVVEGVCGEGFVTSGSSTTGTGAVGSYASGARSMSLRVRGARWEIGVGVIGGVVAVVLGANA
ncbi:hypothetical protein D9758_017041 [Tetrapyrgos nigripes]|uniref:Uncharacterized protein n=1 Tax=Tetrapyrgos nigripes TaxID=182062 RepID=A0A8H5CLL4_9AGAR|nr:hypothetical protein D9758_017041 [Tetrapyrgos nigripes]